MISRKLSEKLNEQINKEIYSAYLYQDISNYYAVKGLKGFSKWFAIQAGEELDHARKINGYLLDEGITPVLSTIAAPGRLHQLMISSELRMMKETIEQRDSLAGSLTNRQRKRKMLQTWSLSTIFLDRQARGCSCLIRNWAKESDLLSFLQRKR